MMTEKVPEFPSYPRTGFLYGSSVLFCLTGIALLPFLEVDISVNTPALIRPSSEVNTIRSLSSGRVKKSYLYENRKVNKGDTLLIIESGALQEQEQFAVEEKSRLQTELVDIKGLIAAARKSTLNNSFEFQNATYRQRYFEYYQKLREAENHLIKARSDYERQQKLYLEKVIAPAEFEDYQFELQKTQDAISQIRENHLSQWQSELKVITQKLHELDLKLAELARQKIPLTIKSPIKGTLQNITGIYPNSDVFTNQEIGIISPDTSLIAIAFVSPNDIGLLQENMPVRIMVDAFNYNQWGIISGLVLEIPMDIKMLNNQPVFEVRCSLNRDFLQLKNGQKGYLKKGMSLQARFLITRRSLWQLLYDRVDNWINPNAFRHNSVSHK